MWPILYHFEYNASDSLTATDKKLRSPVDYILQKITLASAIRNFRRGQAMNVGTLYILEQNFLTRIFIRMGPIFIPEYYIGQTHSDVGAT